ncbi:MAG: leucine-rich repeat protein [Candidatus Lokiarchaeota archaeon]|nr:leucine-rich repeat protein [Candidatus Lokiarchaeota archaeon]
MASVTFNSKPYSYTQDDKYLDLKAKRIKNLTDIKGLDKCTDLEALNLGSNEIKEIVGLENLRNLKRLYLEDNQIQEIKGLDNLVNLETLVLKRNHIKEIKGLDELRSLKSLNLENNHIEDIKGLESLSNLNFLSLTHNPIKSIENIEHLDNLMRIFLDKTKLKNYDKIISETGTAQEIVEYSLNKEDINFDDYDISKTLKENLKDLEEKMSKLDESIIINFGTHKEREKYFKMRRLLFLKKQHPSKKLITDELSIKNENIVIHLIQFLSLKGVNKKKRKSDIKSNKKNYGNKIKDFQNFTNFFWNRNVCEQNNVLIYDQNREIIKNKIKEMLLLSRYDPKKLPDLIVFPENSIPRDCMDSLKKYSLDNDVIIIGGLEHEESDSSNQYVNKAFIIHDGNVDYQIKQTPVRIYSKDSSKYKQESIKCAIIPEINIYETRIGKMVILICKDFLRLYKIVPKWIIDNDIKFVVIPSLSNKFLPFLSKLTQTFYTYQLDNVYFIFVNVAEYGGSEIFSVDDINRIELNYQLNDRDNIGERLLVRKIKKVKEDSLFEVYVY